MALPYLQSYNDPKVRKAYELYVTGAVKNQEAAAKAAKAPLRTVQRRCADDGWPAERQARKAAGPPVPPPVAAGTSEIPPVSTQVADATGVSEPPQSRMMGMDAMLREWQEVVALLRGGLAAEVRALFAEATANGKRPRKEQIAQMTSLVTNLATLDKKVWCVPDKIETKDTTPAPEDKVRKLTDEQLERELAETERAAIAAVAREAAPGSVN